MAVLTFDRLSIENSSEKMKFDASNLLPKAIWQGVSPSKSIPYPKNSCTPT
jgi:hypothetical protein